MWVFGEADQRWRRLSKSADGSFRFVKGGKKMALETAMLVAYVKQQPKKVRSYIYIGIYILYKRIKLVYIRSLRINISRVSKSCSSLTPINNPERFIHVYPWGLSRVGASICEHVYVCVYV